jgi:hypothetical protein
VQVLAYIAAALIAVWGIAHAIPTKRVVAGFAPITADNRRILTQEWLAESLTMWGMAALLVAVTGTGADTQGHRHRLPHRCRITCSPCGAHRAHRRSNPHCVVQGLSRIARHICDSAAGGQHPEDVATLCQQAHHRIGYVIGVEDHHAGTNDRRISRS